VSDLEYSFALHIFKAWNFILTTDSYSGNKKYLAEKPTIPKNLAYLPAVRAIFFAKMAYGHLPMIYLKLFFN